MQFLTANWEKEVRTSDIPIKKIWQQCTDTCNLIRILIYKSQYIIVKGLVSTHFVFFKIVRGRLLLTTHTIYVGIRSVEHKILSSAFIMETCPVHWCTCDKFIHILQIWSIGNSYNGLMTVRKSRSLGAATCSRAIRVNVAEAVEVTASIGKYRAMCVLKKRARRSIYRVLY